MATAEELLQVRVALRVMADSAAETTVKHAPGSAYGCPACAAARAAREGGQPWADVAFSLGGLIWLVIGIIVAANHDFFAHLDNGSRLGSAVLAVVLWPLVLLDVHIGI